MSSMVTTDRPIGSMKCDVMGAGRGKKKCDVMVTKYGLSIL